MDFVKHPRHTRFIGAPQNWDEATQGPCGSLSVRDIPNPPLVPTMESAWMPNMGEAVALAIGYADLRLGIVGQPQHPVVYMSVHPKSMPWDHDALAAQFELVLAHLIGVAESHNIILTAERSCSPDGTRITMLDSRVSREVYQHKMEEEKARQSNG
jgi:hypothetical protein